MVLFHQQVSFGSYFIIPSPFYFGSDVGDWEMVVHFTELIPFPLHPGRLE